MNITSAAALAALILTGAPTLASAAAVQVAPITLDSTSIAQAIDEDSFQPGMVSVRFTNQNKVAATDVVFKLVDGSGNILAQYEDVGSYPQGATIRRNFRDTHLDNNQQLEVDQISFADGTSWSAPSSKQNTATIFPAE